MTATGRPAGAARPFRARFDCLWCGTAWEVRGPNDLEGWAQLCPTCVGRAGDNVFLRGRLRAAIAARAAATATDSAALGASVAGEPALAGPTRRRGFRPRSLIALPGDWFLRRGDFEHGPVHDAAWAAELDQVTRWLDAQPISGRILEPAAGVGFFSPLLAERGELHASDADGDALDLARERLVAHRLLAHLHVADPWAAGDGATGDPARAPAPPPADALVAAFLVGRVRGAGLDGALASLARRLRTGGRLALIDLRPDASGGPPAGMSWTYHEPALLEAALVRAGFGHVEVTTTGRFFLFASAERV